MNVVRVKTKPGYYADPQMATVGKIDWAANGKG